MGPLDLVYEWALGEGYQAAIVAWFKDPKAGCWESRTFDRVPESRISYRGPFVEFKGLVFSSTARCYYNNDKRCLIIYINHNLNNIKLAIDDPEVFIKLRKVLGRAR